MQTSVGKHRGNILLITLWLKGWGAKPWPLWLLVILLSYFFWKRF